MTIEDVKQKLGHLIGKRALVIAKDHPHYDEIAEVKEIDYCGGKPAMIMKTEWVEFAVFSGKDLKFID